MAPHPQRPTRALSTRLPLAVLLLSLPFNPLHAQWAQSAPHDSIGVDQLTQRVLFWQGDVRKMKDSTQVKTFNAWDYINLKHPGPVAVVLLHSSSALYTCSLGTKTATDPTLDTLQSALTSITPYLGTLAGVAGGLVGSRDQASPGWVLPSGVPRTLTKNSDDTDKAVNAAIDTVDQVLADAFGVQDYRLHALRALDSLNISHYLAARSRALRGRTPAPDSQVETRDSLAVARFRAWADSDSRRVDHPGFLNLTVRLVQAVDKLRQATLPLQQRVAKAESGAPAADTDVLKSANAIVGNADAMVAASYSTETIAAAVYNNSSTVHCGDVQVPRGSPRELDLTVAQQTAPELVRIASVPGYSLTVYATPYSWPVRPTVGIAGIYVVQAVYPKKVAVHDSTNTTNYTVVQNGSQDNRGQYGITLGFRITALDENLEKLTPGLWAAPQLVFAPTSARALGAGAAAGWGPVSLGGGAMWTQFTDYTTPVGTVIPDPGLLQSHSSYGRPRVYWLLSLSLWPTGLGGGGASGGGS